MGGGKTFLDDLCPRVPFVIFSGWLKQAGGSASFWVNRETVAKVLGHTLSLVDRVEGESSQF
jgi:hypothetical protein